MAQETFSPFSGGIESEKGVLKACSGHLLNAHSEREREREREMSNEFQNQPDLIQALMILAKRSSSSMVQQRTKAKQTLLIPTLFNVKILAQTK